MKAAIAGASGYTGETLLRLLAAHPHVQLTTVTSRSLAGQPVEKTHPAMRGRIGNLCFSPSQPEKLAVDSNIDLVFLALPHGAAATFASPLVEAGKKIIDLSADFRLGSPELYADYYGQEHPHPELLQCASYVIPEIAPSGWEKSAIVACPGCYPTSILMPLVPLLENKLLDGRNIVINSLSGISGAGKKADLFYSFAERQESVVAYGLPRHRHLSEIEEQLSAAAGTSVVVQFAPHLVPMKAGIATTITVPGGESSLECLYRVWEKNYGNSPFVTILPSGTFPDTAHVKGTNRIEISALHDRRTGNFVITSAIDNLIKGAAGQAVQIMNLMCGFPETAGLI